MKVNPWPLTNVVNNDKLGYITIMESLILSLCLSLFLHHKHPQFTYIYLHTFPVSYFPLESFFSGTLWNKISTIITHARTHYLFYFGDPWSPNHVNGCFGWVCFSEFVKYN